MSPRSKSIQVIRTDSRRRRSDPLAGRPGPRQPPLPVVEGCRAGAAVGADCPRCGGHHRYEAELAVTVVPCPKTGGKFVLVVEGGSQ